MQICVVSTCSWPSQRAIMEVSTPAWSSRIAAVWQNVHERGLRRGDGDASIAASLGSVGDWLDNAVIESVFSTLKRELVDRYSWPTKADLRAAIFEWIEVFYNRTRLHTTLGNYAPEEFENLSLSDQVRKAA